ncbi:hypothetical protein AC578_5819 [Pseudocercospora eumusae]|uniref:Uncharacterized protein n=1 Tax=Pseudocercospora eumusae TaxID=321146 RepID=A0A139HCI2_9PEZI|nr:hypothetical protein AC578_5819 [Pseudocercospora eumusae]
MLKLKLMLTLAFQCGVSGLKRSKECTGEEVVQRAVERTGAVKCSSRNAAAGQDVPEWSACLRRSTKVFYFYRQATEEDDEAGDSQDDDDDDQHHHRAKANPGYLFLLAMIISTPFI